ncbi:hypothetical protein P7C70_g8418, partial [Phenoliferia sp. Uapishka_3]
MPPSNRSSNNSGLRHGSSEQHEAQIAAAIAHFRRELGEDEVRESIPEIARQFDLNENTLRHRLNGTSTSARASHARQQALDPVEEQELVKLILKCSKQGVPLRACEIHQRADEIIRNNRDPSHTTLGKNWVGGFAKRHPEVKAAMEIWLESIRAKCATPEAIKSFFDAAAIALRDSEGNPLPPQNIGGMDEKGTMLGDVTRAKVYIGRNEKAARSQKDGGRINITTIESIMASGHHLPPYVIYPQKGNLTLNSIYTTPGGVDPLEPCHYATQENGWNDADITMSWLKVWDEEIRKISDMRYPRALFWDGFATHISIEVLEYAWRNNIVVVCYPPHCTHILQGLDVVIFSPLKTFYSQEVKALTAIGRVVTKKLFNKLYAAASAKAFTRSSVIRAFEVTGLYPLDPSRVKPDLLVVASAAEDDEEMNELEQFASQSSLTSSIESSAFYTTINTSGLYIEPITTIHALETPTPARQEPTTSPTLLRRHSSFPLDPALENGPSPQAASPASQSHIIAPPTSISPLPLPSLIHKIDKFARDTSLSPDVRSVLTEARSALLQEATAAVLARKRVEQQSAALDLRRDGQDSFAGTGSARIMTSAEVLNERYRYQHRKRMEELSKEIKSYFKDHIKPRWDQQALDRAAAAKAAKAAERERARAEKKAQDAQDALQKRLEKQRKRQDANANKENTPATSGSHKRAGHTHGHQNSSKRRKSSAPQPMRSMDVSVEGFSSEDEEARGEEQAERLTSRPRRAAASHSDAIRRTALRVGRV